MLLARHGCRSLFLCLIAFFATGTTSVRVLGETPKTLEIVTEDSVLVVGDAHSVALDAVNQATVEGSNGGDDSTGERANQTIGTRETLVQWPASRDTAFTLVARLRRFPDGETVWKDKAEIPETTDASGEFEQHHFIWPEPNETGIYELIVERREPLPPRSRLWSKIGLDSREIVADHQTIYVRGDAQSLESSLSQSQSPPQPRDSIEWREIGSVEPSQSSWLVIGSWLPDRLKPVLRREKLATTEHLGQTVSVLPAGHVFQARLPHGGNDQLHRITLEVPANQVADWEMVVSNPDQESVAELKTTWSDRPPIQFDAATGTENGWRRRSFIIPGRSDLQIWLTNRNTKTDAKFKAIHVETTAGSDRPRSLYAQDETVRERYAYLTDSDWYESPIEAERFGKSEGGWTATTLRAQAVKDRCRVLNWRSRFESLALVLPIERCLESDPWIASVALDVMDHVVVSVPSKEVSDDATWFSQWLFGEPQTVKIIVRDETTRPSDSGKAYRHELHRWASTHQTKIDWLESVLSDRPAVPQTVEPTVASAEQPSTKVLRWAPVAKESQSNQPSHWLLQERSHWMTPSDFDRPMYSSLAMTADRFFEPLDSRAWPCRTGAAISFATVWARSPQDHWMLVPPSEPSNQLVDIYQHDDGQMVIINRSPWASSVDLRTRARMSGSWSVIGDAGTIENQSGKYVRVRLAPQAWVGLSSAGDHISIESWTSVVADGIEVVEEVKRRVTTIVEHVGTLAEPAVDANVLLDQFEETATRSITGDSLSPWMHAQHPPGCVGAANDSYPEGLRCVRMTTTENQAGRTWLVSPTIVPPTSGRLGVSFACRHVQTNDSSADSDSVPVTASSAISLPIADDETIKLRLAFEGVAQGEPIRVAKEMTIPTDHRWQSFPLALECEGFSPESIESLRLTIDLMSPGEIHLDDLRLVSDFVPRHRRTQIQKQSFLAVAGLKRGNLTQCIELLHNWGATELLWRHPGVSFSNGGTSGSGDRNPSKVTLPGNELSREAASSMTPPAVSEQTDAEQAVPSVAERIRTWIPNPFRY